MFVLVCVTFLCYSFVNNSNSSVFIGLIVSHSHQSAFPRFSGVTPKWQPLHCNYDYEWEQFLSNNEVQFALWAFFFFWCTFQLFAAQVNLPCSAHFRVLTGDVLILCLYSSVVNHWALCGWRLYTATVGSLGGRFKLWCWSNPGSAVKTILEKAGL